MDDYIYDIESYPNCFILGVKHVASGLVWQYRITDRVNHSTEIVHLCSYIAGSKGRMIGFNNIGFDYPILHMLLRMGRSDAKTLFQKAQAIIQSQEQNRWLHGVKPTDRIVPQVDLFLIHHFDNVARARSLKALQFNMRMDSIEDLPFPVGSVLDDGQIEALCKYNLHDLDSTERFLHESKEQIRFREELSRKYDRDFMNHNDTKIGKDFFVMELERAGIPCYDYSPELGRTPRQTKRPVIHLREAILPNIGFSTPDLQRVLDWMKQQSITETKGVFKNLTAKVGDFELVFGLGGIHGSVENSHVVSDAYDVIVDLDVESYYPSTAIVQRFRPAHYPEKFCDIYANLKEQRKAFAKGTPENAMLKLALNGVFGDSNNEYSVFYDPLLTMKITLNGQLMLCMLIEWLVTYVPSLKMVQANTDGVTVKIPRFQMGQLDNIVNHWEQFTGLKMEKVLYKQMFIRDVNNYIAESDQGKVKRKGAYEYKVGWHQDQGSLVIPKVAEQVLLYDKPIRETLENWPDRMDFMMRVKVPRTGYLTYRAPEVSGDTDFQIQNTTRYYVAKNGVQLGKWLPPLKGSSEWRRIAVEAGWRVCVCNKISDAVLPIDYDYYVREVEKIALPVM